MTDTRNQVNARFGRDAEPWPRRRPRPALGGVALVGAVLLAGIAVLLSLSLGGGEREQAGRGGEAVGLSGDGDTALQQVEPDGGLRPALDPRQAEILYDMARASMRPYNCNLDFDDDTAARYGTAYYRLTTRYDSAATLEWAHKAGKGISCATARDIAARAWSAYTDS